MILTIVVVVYKIKLDDSKTLNSLAKMKFDSNVKLVVWDNSPVIQDYDSLNFSGRLDYRHHPENTPLSVLYNTVVRENRESSYFLFLDQDSFLPSNYIEVFIEHQYRVRKSDCSIFIPLVNCGLKRVSPGYFFLIKGFHSGKIKPGLRRANLFGKKIVCITSGMFVSGDYFLGGNYFDERLGFYGIDTKFLLDYSSSRRQIYILPIVFEHETALWNEHDPVTQKARKRMLIDSWLLLFPKYSFRGVLMRIYVFVYRLLKN